ncbi:MAG: type II toxin-antitoxin system RatA family toxin [Chloroflexota bacterium]
MWTLENGVFHISAEETIEAPISLVYEVVSDVTKYPEFINDVPAAKMEGDTCIITLRVGPMKIPLKTKVETEPLKFVQFTLLEGPVKRLVGRWAFEGDDKSTTINLSAEVEAGSLGQWMMRMAGKLADRQIEKIEASYRERIASKMKEG